MKIEPAREIVRRLAYGVIVKGIVQVPNVAGFFRNTCGRSDPGAGGFWAMRYRPGFEGRVRWNADEDGVIVARTQRR